MNQNHLFKEYEGVFKESEEPSSLSSKKERIYRYNPFALQDALGERDVKRIWIEYNRLRFDGVEAEDLIHKIISKVRDMAAIKAGASKEDLKMKDYPYSKSKRDARNWSKEELESFYTKLVSIYHLSHMGGEELDMAVEKTLLTL